MKPAQPEFDFSAPLRVRIIFGQNGEGSIETEGFSPFEMHGERFAVTANFHPGIINPESEKYRVSHIGTGAGIPGSYSETILGAAIAGRGVLERAGLQKTRDAIAQIKAKIEG